MNSKVEEYLEQKRWEITTKELHEREELLLRLGLYEKVYSTEKMIDKEHYPYSEWDTESSEYRYYKKIPIEVTDEEFEEILKCSGRESNESGHGAVAAALNVVGWLCIIGGMISGLVQERGFSLVYAAPFWAAGIIGGIMLFGFSKVICLLEDIKDRLSENK